MLIKDARLNENRSQRQLCILLLDLSTSMLDKDPTSGRPKIDLLYEGLARFAAALKADDLTACHVQVAVLGFGREGKVWVITEPCDAADFDPEPLMANGTTPMGEAVMAGLDLGACTVETYREHAVPHYCPWIWLITDGLPTDDWKSAAAAAVAAEKRRDAVMFPVGVGADADLKVLSRFSVERPPLQMEAANFNGLFVFISKSLAAVSRSKPGDEIDLGFGKAVKV